MLALLVRKSQFYTLLPEFLADPGNQFIGLLNLCSFVAHFLNATLRHFVSTTLTGAAP